MTITPTVPRPTRLVVRSQPGLVERCLVVAVLFINLFGTPADWFVETTGSASGPGANPLLVIGTLGIVGILSLGLVGNGDALVSALNKEPLLLAFIALTIFSFLWTADLGASLSAIVNFSLTTLLAYILVIRFRFIEIVQLAVITMAIGTAMNLFWVLAMGSLGRSAAGWDGLGTQKNALGTTVVLTLPFFAILLRARPRWRFPLYVLLVTAAVLVVGSQSKTSLASGGLTLAAALVYVGFRARKTLYGAVVITLVVTSVVAVLFATANLAVLAGWLEKDVTLTGRTVLWSEVVEKIQARPILGYGYGGFWNGYGSGAHEVWTSSPWQPTHAHNAGLNVAVQVGLVGLALFLIVNVRAVVRATSRIRYVEGPLGLLPLVYLTLVLMASITESGVFGQRFGWTMFVVMVLSAKVTEAEWSQARKKRRPSELPEAHREEPLALEA